MKAWMSYEVSWAMLLKLKPFSCQYGEIYANTLNINELSKPEPICFLKSSADTWKNGVLLTEKKLSILNYHAFQSLTEGINVLKQ